MTNSKKLLNFILPLSCVFTLETILNALQCVKSAQKVSKDNRDNLIIDAYEGLL